MARICLLTISMVVGIGAPFPIAQNASLPVRERIITRHFPITIPPHPQVRREFTSVKLYTSDKGGYRNGGRTPRMHMAMSKLS
jgi:hypothetical protein